ncbi:FecR domain-containing protein [Paenibacillus ferrarius]|uniref:FecR family protein n=1 Tax=Paenibacillus ferrarius TaxID=1469647 RepID=UPI003D289A88
MRVTSKSLLSFFLSLSLMLSVFSFVLAKPADAKTVRVAIIASLSGDVTVKKGGGSKTYDAYESMSLNQGDTIYTGDDSSVTLNLSNGDADVTLGDNAELNVSDLNSADGNKKSKLKVWAGSLWVKVKSLAGSDDEFEVETPTAVMGVRGTQFYVSVDPVTGNIKMAVGAGKVSATTVRMNDANAQQESIAYLYPTQQITLDSRDEAEDLDTKVEFLDLEDFIKQASPAVIEEFIKNKAEIDKENDEFIAQKQKELNEGKSTSDNTSLSLKSQADLEKVKKNLDNLVGNIAKEALNEQKFNKDSMNKIIEEANKKITDGTKKIDLSKVQPLDKTAGVDPELEKKKQEKLKVLEEKKLQKKIEAEKKLEDAKKKLADQLKALEEQKKKQEEAQKAAEAKAKADAEAKLKASMTEQEKKDYDNAKDGKTSTPTTTTGSGSGSGSGSGGNDNNNNPDPGTPQPSVKLTAALANDKVDEHGYHTYFDLGIDLSDFTGSNDIFGVEVHLQYNGGIWLNRDEPQRLGNIFAAESSADYLKAYEYEEGYYNSQELVYAVTNLANGQNIGFTGSKHLVTIPMGGWGGNQIAVSKIVIVRKNGTNVQNIEIPITNISPVVSPTDVFQHQGV